MIASKEFKLYAILFLIIFAISYLYIGTYDFELGKLEAINSKGFENYKKYELALIYIGSSTCGFCNSKKLQRTYKSINSNLQFIARKYGFRFSSIGIAKDYVVTEGLLH